MTLNVILRILFLIAVYVLYEFFVTKFNLIKVYTKNGVYKKVFIKRIEESAFDYSINAEKNIKEKIAKRLNEQLKEKLNVEFNLKEYYLELESTPSFTIYTWKTLISKNPKEELRENQLYKVEIIF